MARTGYIVFVDSEATRDELFARLEDMRDAGFDVGTDGSDPYIEEQ